MRSFFDDTPLVHYADSVSIAHSRQAMSDEENGSIAHGNVNCSLHFVLAGCIQGACSLVQQQHCRLPEQRPCDRYSLLLPSAQAAPLFTCNGFVPTGQIANKFVSVCKLSRSNNAPHYRGGGRRLWKSHNLSIRLGLFDIMKLGLNIFLENSLIRLHPETALSPIPLSKKLSDFIRDQHIFPPLTRHQTSQSLQCPPLHLDFRNRPRLLYLWRYVLLVGIVRRSSPLAERELSREPDAFARCNSSSWVRVIGGRSCEALPPLASQLIDNTLLFIIETAREETLPRARAHCIQYKTYKHSQHTQQESSNNERAVVRKLTPASKLL
jgi:hypothetical protein